MKNSLICHFWMSKKIPFLKMENFIHIFYPLYLQISFTLLTFSPYLFYFANFFSLLSYFTVVDGES